MAKKQQDEDVAVDGEEGAPKKSKKKLIIIIVAALLLIGGGGAGAYFGGFIGPKKNAKEATDTAEAEHGEEAAEGGEHDEEAAEEGEHGDGEAKAKPIPGVPVFFTLPGFLVNLNTGSTQVSFLKATVVLELASAKDKAMIEAMQPRIVDDFTTYLRELRSSDLAGSAGLERLREELLARINKAIAPAKVNNILFKEIIVQ